MMKTRRGVIKGAVVAGAALAAGSADAQRLLTTGTGPPPPPAPTVSSISPNTGTTSGGTPVSITGNNFTAPATVSIGGVPAANVNVQNVNVITCTTGAGGTVGPASVVVTTTAGSNAGNTLFTYTSAAPVPVVTAIYPNAGYGNTLATIVGSGFTGATAVNVGTGSAAVQSFTVTDDNHIDAYMAFHSLATRSVFVTTPGGTSSGSVTFTHGVPEIATIPATPDLTNPYVFTDGVTAVTTKAQWALRQREMRESWAAYWIGHTPPPSSVSFTSKVNDATVGGAAPNVRNVQVNLSAGGIVFGLNFYIPLAAGAGPFPVLLSDSWAFSPLIATPSSTNNNSLGPANINTLCNRGYILCEVSSDQFSLDNGDTSPPEGIFTDTTPLLGNQLANPGPGSTGNGAAPVGGPANHFYSTFGLDRNGGPTITYPSYITTGLNAPPSGAGAITAQECGVQGAWLWGHMRVLDYLIAVGSGLGGVTIPLDPNKIAVTGISHNSGPPLTLAAFDTRVAACLISQGLGIYSGSRLGGDLDQSMGGTGPPPPTTNDPNDGSGENGVMSAPRSSCRYIGPAVIATGAGSRTIFQNFERITSDTHILMAMCAPRGFWSGGFIGSGGIDSPRAMAQKFICGRTAYAALGAPLIPQCWWTDNTNLTTDGHELGNFEYVQMLNYLDYYFKGTSLPSDVNTVGSKSIWCNTLADLQSKVPGTPVNGSTLTSNTTCGFTWTPPSTLT